MSAALLVGVAGCVRSNDPAPGPPSSTIRIGFGLTSGADTRAGIRQVLANVESEGLLTYGPDGRPQPRLAEGWSLSPDGLTLRVQLTPGVLFHNGTPVTAAIARDVLLEQLPVFIGPAMDEIETLSAVSETELEFRLRRRSSFVLEGLDSPILSGDIEPVGTGPFRPTGSVEDGRAEMVANAEYHRGRPLIDRVVVEQYPSVRSAWAGLLRQEVDMVYEVGVDAVDLLQPSSGVNVYSSPRPYVLAVILNLAKPHLKDPAFRRALNAAIDREALVAEGLNGHGSPADGPVWPYHWAYSESLPKFTYAPRRVGVNARLSLLFTEASHERLALMLQRQLQAIGVDLTLETAPLDQAISRVIRGDFDAFLIDAAHGPMMVRPYLMWHSRAPRNWGHFSSAEVDQAFETIQRAPDDEAYRAGVAAFQRAIVNDPPAIFLTWGERSRAVSSSFEVPAEPNRDIFPTTLRLWRPVDARTATQN
ncbi:MAG: ABC transporter substrate-binding protein [Vicinamibacterales bacterium]